tara:strand:- start:170 stop:337 length:168 start_codon:yes stop_codon:yes gene_type:complete
MKGIKMYMQTIKDTAIIEQLRVNAYASLRTAKAIEEILRLVKKDMGINAKKKSKK